MYLPHADGGKTCCAERYDGAWAGQGSATSSAATVCRSSCVHGLGGAASNWVELAPLLGRALPALDPGARRATDGRSRCVGDFLRSRSRATSQALMEREEMSARGRRRALARRHGRAAARRRSGRTRSAPSCSPRRPASPRPRRRPRSDHRDGDLPVPGPRGRASPACHRRPSAASIPACLRWLAGLRLRGALAASRRGLSRGCLGCTGHCDAPGGRSIARRRRGRSLTASRARRSSSGARATGSVPARRRLRVRAPAARADCA